MNRELKIQQSFLEFHQVNDTGKTKVWKIVSVGSHNELGRVGWYTPWRVYVFCTTSAGTIFDAKCLGELTAFIDEQNADHKEKRDVKKCSS
jgi:hypothetical protein